MTPLRALVIFPTAAVLGCLGLWLTAQRHDPFNQKRFDSAAWKAGPDSERAPMTRDAIRHVPPGTPEEDVVALLGGEVGGGISTGELIEKCGLPGGYPPGAVRTHMYGLGGDPLAMPMNFDNAFLYVHIGADGRVVSTEIGSW